MKRFKHPVVALVIIAIFLYFTILTAVVYSIFSRNGLILMVDTKNKSNAKSIDSESSAFVLNLDGFYTMRDTVNCLDTLLKKRNSKSLHIAFIGDSLIRNQYTNYLKLIPDYDRKVSWDIPPWSVDDRNVTFRLLNDFQTSFFWRPLINENFLSEFRKWKDLEEPQAPYLIFLGATVHHMQNKNDNGRTFDQLLEEDLLPVLRDYLTTHPLRQVVWLTQTPSLDKHVSLPTGVIPDIHFDNIHRYNEITRRIFNGTQILVLNLFDSFVEEYTRSCALVNYQRVDDEKYFFCSDFLHPGFGVTFSFATHLLLRHICYYST